MYQTVDLIEQEILQTNQAYFDAYEEYDQVCRAFDLWKQEIPHFEEEMDQARKNYDRAKMELNRIKKDSNRAGKELTRLERVRGRLEGELARTKEGSEAYGWVWDAWEQADEDYKQARKVHEHYMRVYKSYNHSYNQAYEAFSQMDEAYRSSFIDLCKYKGMFYSLSCAYLKKPRIRLLS